MASLSMNIFFVHKIWNEGMSEWIFALKIAWIFKYMRIFIYLIHSNTLTNKCTYKLIRHERMSDYICKRKIDTNECPNKYIWPIYSNIWINICHTLVCFVNSNYSFIPLRNLRLLQCTSEGSNLYPKMAQ